MKLMKTKTQSLSKISRELQVAKIGIQYRHFAKKKRIWKIQEYS